jgi:hypothetical protein
LQTAVIKEIAESEFLFRRAVFAALLYFRRVLRQPEVCADAYDNKENYESHNLTKFVASGLTSSAVNRLKKNE